MHAQKISELEDTVAAMQIDFERTLSTSTASQMDLQDSLVSAKHELLHVQDQLALAEKVLILNAPQFQCTANDAVLHISIYQYFKALLAFLLLPYTVYNTKIEPHLSVF